MVDRSDALGIQVDRFLLVGTANFKGDLEGPSSSASKLDFKSPGKAEREYQRGYQLLQKNDLDGAVQHLTKAIATYAKFVAAHEALGVAYLKLGQNEQAKQEFARAVELDDHLPNSYLNLGCAELALKEYAEAEKSIRSAATIAPLDLSLQLALVYAEYLNKDYPAVFATTEDVHGRAHEGAARVHFYAAAAWLAQRNLDRAQQEMETLLKEDPRSDSAAQYQKILEQIEASKQRRAAARQTAMVRPEPSPEEIASRRDFAQQQEKEASQIAEAEAAADPACVECESRDRMESSGTAGSGSANDKSRADFRVTADEVSVMFAAVNHGKSVTDLAVSDVAIEDDGHPPSAILSFRNESQLPLRLGLVIDISSSINSRFSFEQEAASKFLRNVVANKDDQAFVAGVSQTVFVVQDFTGDHAAMSRAVNELAPKGGTALWDAVAFAANKLARHAEDQPVARVLVIISDGQDNSSTLSLKQAIASAQRGEVAVYTVNSRDKEIEIPGSDIGDHALRTLSEMTGGTAFKPGSMNQFVHSLSELEEVIRGRYLVSYKPASFERDDRYRAIDIEAQKDGRKLTVFARKGYYASGASSPADR